MSEPKREQDRAGGTAGQGTADRSAAGASGGSADLIDEALRLVDALQRKLIVEGVRLGASAASSPPPGGGDVWEEAIRAEQPQPEEPPLNQVLDIMRTTAPEVAGHLGRAGLALFGAVERSWSVIERSLEQQRQDSGEAGPDSSDGQPQARLPRGG